MWLVHQDLYDKIKSVDLSSCKPTIVEFEAYRAEVESNGHPQLVGSTASIHVAGLLTDAPDFMAAIFGGGNTTYGAIIAAIQAAESNSEVSRIDLVFDSGGGMASALWLEAINAFKNTTKPTRAIVSSMAASAAYGLAAQADELIAINNMSVVGSVGVVTSRRIDDTLVEITSSNAENKRPDANTDRGKDTIRAEIDQVENEFITAVAEGRNTTVGNVRDNFGRGGQVLAADALTRGMIDSISADNVRTSKVTAQSSDQPLGALEMDLNLFKTEHPAIYAEAVQVGTQQERTRVAAHATLGKAAGAESVALAAIEDGSECDQLAQAKYLAVQMGKKASVSIEADEAAVALAAANARTGGDDTSEEDQHNESIVAAVEKQLGIEV